MTRSHPRGKNDSPGIMAIRTRMAGITLYTIRNPDTNHSTSHL